jgi:serine/threonine protein kinase/Tol biopolymer transport system component
MLESHGRAVGFLSTPAVALLDQASALPSLAGQRIGPYLLGARIGAGGMGVVYKARDTRLDRTVAIKVLPSDIAADLQARERFDREGRAIAALNHPHICALYDSGETASPDRPFLGPIRFLVMEYLEGETLADRLTRGAVPLSHALQVAVQIASALDGAHRAGIVHRDLKPANVFLLRSGASAAPTAKLLDFGLAKASAVPIGGALTQPAVASDLTTPGTILGTVQYMAPEQLEGKDADARADLFAFGAVLYEMVTGRKAFEGGSRASLIAAILEHEPLPLSSLQPLTPPILERIVNTCLAKDPDDRWQTARDLLRELTWARDGDASTRATPPAGVRRRGALTLVAALAIALLASYAIYSARRQVPAAAPPSISFSIYAPEGTKFPRGTAEMAVSPDGSRLAFVALSADSTRHLWMRRFDSVAARPLDGTEDAFDPFWSPDGRSLGFFARGKLKRIAEGGGSPQIVCDVAHAVGGAWNRDGTILLGTWDGPIRRVADTGGVPTPVTTLDESRKERGHAWPVFLPDGRRFLYLARSDDREQMATYQGSLDSTQTHRLLATESNVGATGTYLFSLSNRSLIAQVYDPDHGQVVGEPITVVEQIALDNPQRSGGAFSVGANGVLAYRSASPDSHLVWFDRTGKEVGSFRAPGDYHHPWLSQDEKRVAVEKTDAATGRHTIWILDLSRGITSRLVSDAAGAHAPVWSPDGSRVVFNSNRLGGNDLYWRRADGVGGDELILSSERVGFVSTDWSLDGRFLLYQTQVHNDLWILPVSPIQKARPFFEATSNEKQGQFFPDVRWIAYSSDESGTWEVYVRRFPGADGKWQVSTHGGAQPRWRRDGKELFYLAPDGKLMAADVKIGGSTFETGTPRALFNTGITASFIDRRNHYAVTRNGQRFLVNISAEDENSAPITVVLNWEATSNK